MAPIKRAWKTEGACNFRPMLIVEEVQKRQRAEKRGLNKTQLEKPSHFQSQFGPRGLV